MIILFTLWLILNWTFPTWLWIISGVIFASQMGKVGKNIHNISKRNYKNNKKSVIGSQSTALPLFLALALVFGSFPNGNSIIQDGQGWTILFILIISGILSGGTVHINNKKSKNISVEPDGEIIKQNIPLKGKNLIIKIDKNGKNKSKYKINLSAARFFSRMIPKKAREKMEEKGINLNDIIKQVRETSDIGVLAEIEDNDEHITISIE